MVASTALASDGNEVLFEGKLWHCRVGDDKKEQWSQAQAKLSLTGIELHVGATQTFVELGPEHYVGDSGRRQHGFLLSDFADTVYFAAVTEATKQKWMQSLATALRKIGTREREGQCGGFLASSRTSNTSPRPEDSAPSAALLELRVLEEQYQRALAWLDDCVDLRRKAQRWADESLADETERRERERAEKTRLERAAKQRKEEEEKRKEEQRQWEEQQARIRKLNEDRQRKQQEEAEQLIARKKEQTERRRSLPRAPPGGGGGILSRIQGWNSKLENIQDADKANPFSGNYVGPSGGAPRPGEDGYGCAKAGSKTAERAAKAQEWVDKEINKFVSVVKDIGESRPDGTTVVTFGKLFVTYQDISDTLVGIMMRAKKRKHIHYEGDMLFQGRDNDVLVTLLATSSSS